ncbi:MAG: hypothetical protein JXA10_11450 [Anaerolineae bacterium]|nr:hypothetical protein [Anaerolineae bacterium]
MKLTAFAPLGLCLVASYRDELPRLMIDDRHADVEQELTVITADAAVATWDTATGEAVMWRDLHMAWGTICAATPGQQLNAWRTIWHYGYEIVPGLRIFQLLHSATPRFFCLGTELDEVEAQVWLGDVLLLLLDWAHITAERGYIHAAGVIHNGAAYVFVGHSGAGKSTISALSEAEGDTVIHDDRIVIMPGANKQFVATNRLLAMTPTPLQAFFFIVQDTRDYLIPLEAHDTAERLLTSALDTGRTQQILLQHSLRRVFASLATIARHVPGYELHFRKSADFWTEIDTLFNAEKL